MDNAQPKLTKVKISRNCDEISAHHFYKLRETSDLQWLYPKYDGWEEIADRLPENAQEVSENIADEYSKLIKNNATMAYMECIDDIENLVTRIYGVSIILDNIKARWGFMAEDVRQDYIDTLKGWNFIFRPEKGIEKELERLFKQVRAARTKLKRLEADKKQMENKSAKKGVDLTKLKVQVQNILKRDIDLRKISIKEWHYTLESLPRKQAA